MSKLIITRGLPGSGKSTWAQTQIADRVTTVNRDELRRANFGVYSGLSHIEEQEVSNLHRQAVTRLLNKGWTVIDDSTNLSDKGCREWRDLAYSVGAEFEVKDFRDVPLETCIDRNTERALAGGRFVPVNVIKTMWEKNIRNRKLSQPLDPTPIRINGEFSGKVYVPDTSLPKAIIVDIDGTLADHIGPDPMHPLRDPYDESRYHVDLLHEPVAEIDRTMFDANYKILVTSGRHQDYRGDTSEWLYDNYITCDQLIMREGPGNDADVKEALFWKYIAPYYNVIAAIDDRNRVVERWRQMGIKCLQAQPGDF